MNNTRKIPLFWGSLLVLCSVCIASEYKIGRPSLDQFLNYGVKRTKLGWSLENEIIKSKVTVLGDLLKKHVQKLRQAPGQNVELVFLVDSSASVGAENFFNEIKFVRKLLADFTVAYNHTRVAVITFSSRSKVIRQIDHVAQASERNHKCSLLEKELPKIRYSGGGTYTLGALLEAQGVLAISRNDSTKAVFLVTDGYSNGGDPRPAAEFLKSRGVIIFTFGIQNGNVKELYDMASDPKEEHSYILGSFQEFEALARRALHEDLQRGVVLSQRNRECNSLCEEGRNCCDKFADCTCGADTGVNACTCRKGYYGSGLVGDCKRCPAGTFRDFEGIGDVTTCQACPDPYMTSEEGSTSPFQCYCRRGYTQTGLSCQKMQCPVLEPPRNGFFTRGSCENVVNAACGIMCNPGYKLKGSSIRQCGDDGTWSGTRAKCVMKTCPKLKPPKNGTMMCTSDDGSIDTECNFRCNPGFQLVGSRTRSCLPVSMWDGIRVICRPIFCPSHPTIRNGFLKPPKCTVGKTKYGSVCEFGCNAGYVLKGPEKTACIGKGIWSGEHKSRCVDVDPPLIQCPSNVTVKTEPNENYASVIWEKPIAKDRSKGKVLLFTKPATKQPMKMKIGLHKLIYFAKDESGNKANCSFFVNVQDKEPPTVDRCESPPTFLSKDDEVDVFWEEPEFSDNSGVYSVHSSREPGKFPQGESIVQYSAEDRSGNKAYCNITVTVQKHACQTPIDPVNGAANCTENPEAVYCTLTCEDGYAFAMRPQEDYFCAYDGIWMPSENPMPFPECSVTTVSNSISQSGEMALNDEGSSVCNDIFFMSQVENKLEQKLEEALALMCGDDIICNVATVEAVCESILEELEEENNEIFSRKKRHLDEDDQRYIKDYWGSDRYNKFVYWKRDTPHVFEKDLSAKPYLPKSRVKRQFGFPAGLFEKEEEDATIMKEREDEKANFLGVLTSLILESLGNDIGMTHFSSFLTSLGTDSPKYELEDFMVAFAKEFGEEKALSVRKLTEQKLGRFILPKTEKMIEIPSSTPKSKVLDIMDFQADEAAPLVSTKSKKKKNLKVKFKIEGHGDEPDHKVDKAMLSLLEYADQGHFDIDFGEKQLKVAAIRLSEDPEYLCDPGSVLQGKLCVKCPVGTFFNVIAKECQSCPPASFQPEEGQVSCLVCPENTSTKSRNAKSTADCKAMCLPGSFSSDTLEPCETCAIGQYQDQYASSECQACPQNTTTWRRGSWLSDECKPPCPPGMVSENGLMPCVPCPVGSFQEKEGQSKCFVCSNDTSTPDRGSASHTDCIGYTNNKLESYSQLRTLEFNDCFSGPCQNGGTCDALELGYICTCAPGFAGQNCEIEINECESDPCENSGECVDKLASYECNCKPGFTGTQCEININECQSDPCLNNATCVDLVDSFKCMCDSGYTGETCETNIDECGVNPCENGAECIDGISDYTCECSKGFTGRDCQIQIDYCESSPCINGDCKPIVGDFRCECERGYYGKLCDFNVDECASNPCQNGGICQDWINAFSCECLPGFSGKQCEIEMSTNFIMEMSSPGVMDYARLEGFLEPLEETTLCFWMKTADKNNYGTPLSYGTDTHPNAFTLTDYNGFVLYVNGEKKITDVSANDNQWHFICATWKSLNGTWAVFKDGKKKDFGTGLSPSQKIANDGVLVIGQEQDQRGGTFSAPESFVGEIGSLNIWKKSLPDDDIRSLYAKCDRYVGDVRAWPDFETGLMGKIKVKHSPFCSGCGVLSTPANGRLINESSQTGHTVQIICNEGHKLYRGDSERTCLIHGEWSGKEPECRAVSCSFTRPLYNGKSEASSYEYGGVTTYSCNKGYRLIGNQTRKCQANGKWDGEDPRCEIITCPNPDPIPNAVALPGLSSYLPTNKVTYSCTNGYQMDGPPFKTCSKRGEWGKGGSCEPINCGKSLSIKFGKLATEGEIVLAGSSMKVVCDNGFVIKDTPYAECLPDGTWKKPLPKCELPTCEKPPDIENGKVKVRASLTKRQAVYKCYDGYVLDGQKKLSCQADGTWDAPFSKCVEQFCSLPNLPEHGKLPIQKRWRVGEPYVLECMEGFKPKDDTQLDCEEGYDNGEWTTETLECVPVYCESVNRIAGGIFRIISAPENDFNAIVFPSLNELPVSRRRRALNFPSIEKARDKWSEEFPSLSFNSQGSSGSDIYTSKPVEEPNFGEFPGLDFNRDSLSSRSYGSFSGGGSSYSTSHGFSSEGDGDKVLSSSGFPSYTSSVNMNPPEIFPAIGSSEPISQSSGFESYGQASQTGGFDGFGQTSQASGFDGFDQASQTSGFNTYGQTSQTSGFDNYGQTSQTSGFDDHGQTSQTSGFVDYGQTSQTSGFDNYGQTSQTSGFDNYRQTSQTSGFDNYGQTSQTSGFDNYGQTSQTSGFDNYGQTSQTSGFDDYGQTSQTSGFDNHGQTSQTSGFDDYGQVSQTSGFDDYGQTSQTSGFDDYGQISQSSGFEYEEPEAGPLHTIELGSKAAGYLNEKQPYNTTVEYECRPGYKLIGSKHRHCTAEGWDKPEPRCYELYCPEISPIENGALIYFGSGINSKVEFSCNEGYHLEGDVERVCQSSRQWTGKSPKCIQINCNDPKPVFNGTIAYESTFFKSIAVYDCAEGFVLEGSIERHCEASGFWNGSAPRCVPITCEQPRVIRNGFITFEGSLYLGSPVEYACEECYQLIGPEIRKCQMDGTWSLKEPTCELIECNAPESVSNGEFVLGDRSCGSLGKLQCDPGYNVKGKKQSRCTEKARWQGWHRKLPECEKKSCGKPPPLLNGKYLGESFDYMDSVTYECDTGYIFSGEKSVTCNEDGNWSELTAFCKLVECKKPRGPSNGKVRLSGLFYKSYAKIICDPGFEIDGEGHLVCQADGSWNSPMPFCKPIICPPAEKPDNSYYNSTEIYFESFTVLDYNCNSGYYSEDDNTTMLCSMHGNWTGNLIECLPVDCGNPGNPLHGQMIADTSLDAFTYNKNVTFSCDEGFDLVGHHIVTCLETGKWSDTTSCERIECETLEEILNGQAIYEHPHEYFGATIKFKCNPGYILKGSSETMCLETGKWSSPVPQCEPVTCPKPPESFETIKVGDSYEYGKTLYYSCKDGYILKGSSELQCQEDGTWSSPFPICDLVLCKPPYDTANGVYKTRSSAIPIKTEPIKGLKINYEKKKPNSKKSSKVVQLLEDQTEQLMFKKGQQIDLHCEEGYLPTSEVISVCGEQGWFPPPSQCLIVSCPEPTLIRHGQVEQNNLTYGSLITYSCEEGYELIGMETRECTGNETWSGSEPYCRLIECPIPSSLENGKFIGSNYKYKSNISYVCDEGFELRGDPSRICESSKIWSGITPICVEIFCDTPPEVTHAILDVNHLKVGGVANYRCQEGYNLKGSSSIRCLVFGFWNREPPICEQIDCKEMVPEERVIIEGNLTTYNSKITFSCERGYEPEGATQAVCLQNGRWNTKGPVCNMVICANPRVPAHGFIDYGKSTTTMIESPSSPLKSGRKGTKSKKKQKPMKITEPVYGVDNSVVFGCDPGWRVVGPERINCSQSGAWSSNPPVCKRVLCPDPPTQPHVKYTGDDHLYGSVVNISCAAGYVLEGAKSIICNDQSLWEGDPYSCQPVDCGQPMKSSLLVLNHYPSLNGLYKLGSKVEYGCVEGYELKGSKNMVCSESGSWEGSQNMPRCEEKKCASPSPLGNATFTENSGDKQTATYYCNRGYYHVGSENTTMCSLGKWSNLNMTCLPVDCYKPVVPKFAKITAKHFTFGSIANYTCVEGYQLKGNPTVICDADALWKGDLPSCEIVDCGKPEKMQGGSLKYGSTIYQSVAKYTCDKGFELKGDSLRLCTGEGTWSGHVPQCRRVSCPEPHPPKHGFSVGTSYLFGDKVRFTCAPGYQVHGSDSIQCQQDGTWSDATPSCQEVECGPPPFLVNSVLPLVRNDPYVYKDKIEYGCEEGFIPRGDLKSTCNKYGEWSAVKGKCSRIACGKPKINTDGAAIIGRSYYYKDRVKVSCPPGSKPNGTSLLSCQEDGSWSNSVSCVKGCSRNCLNGGVCMFQNTCSCPSGFTGRNCERALCSQPCLNGGKCVGPYKCKCPKLYIGKRCQIPVCRSGCGKTGKCIGPNVCLCKYGDIGETCKDYSAYELQQQSTIFSDWDIAALRGNKFRRP